MIRRITRTKKTKPLGDELMYAVDRDLSFVGAEKFGPGSSALVPIETSVWGWIFGPTSSSETTIYYLE